MASPCTTLRGLPSRSVASTSSRCHSHRNASSSAVRSRAATVVVRANLTPVKPPAGVTLPPKNPEVPPAMFGFVDWAEKMNSRAAMIGFFALLLVESVMGKGLLEAIGYKVGSGLGFEL